MKKILKTAMVAAAVMWMAVTPSCVDNDNKKPSGEEGCCFDPPAIGCTIYLVPLNDVPDKTVSDLQVTLREQLDRIQAERYERLGDEESWNPGYVYEIEVLPRVTPDDSCYNDIHSRYRADKLLGYLKGRFPKEAKKGYLMGVTDKDISTSVHGYPDYGILGLSYMPGNRSVISTYRLKNKKNLWKLAAHEFCHGYFGMPHCPQDDAKCLMADAKGGSPKHELQESFCDTCIRKYAEYK